MPELTTARLLMRCLKMEGIDIAFTSADDGIRDLLRAAEGRGHPSDQYHHS